MVSAAERRVAAKAKLAALDALRREAKTAGQSTKKIGRTAGIPPAPKASRTTVPIKTKLRKQELPNDGSLCAKTIDEAVLAETRTPREQKSTEGRGIARKRRRYTRATVQLLPTNAPQALAAESYREEHNIVCKTVHCPPPLQTFKDAQACLGIRIVQMLRDKGFLAPSPIQAQAWPLALAGRDIVAIAQTGSGKTFAYLLPAVVRLHERGKPSPASETARPRVLVLAPTRELIQQIATDVAKFAISIGHRFVPCFGGVWKTAQLKQLGKGCDMLLSTPGRLKDFMHGVRAQGLAPAANVGDVSYLVLDEADAMLSMGFIPQVREILQQCLNSGEPEQGGGADGPRAGTARQTLFFTATWPRKVRTVARELVSSEAAQLRIGQGVGKDKLTANKNVRQIVQVVEYWNKLERLINVLTSELNNGDTGLVFCGTKGRTEYIVDMINKSWVVDWCEGIHSGKEQWVRDASLERFRRHTASGDKRAVLVATDVAARGLDIPGVALVVVYDLNGWHGELSIDSYVHRIGRTGRDGTIGRAFTFVESRDRGLPDLVKLLKDAGQRIPKPLQEVEAEERAPMGERSSKRARKAREVKKTSGRLGGEAE